MLGLPWLLGALLLHTHAVYAHRPLLPLAGTGSMRPKRIEGLLGRAVRELVCDPGFGLCGNGCCGVSCCSTGSCCPYAPHMAECCTFGGCCPPGQNCERDSEGNEGCCPDGEICEGGGGVTTIGGGGGGKTTHKNPPPPKTTTHKNPPPPKTTTKNHPPPPKTTTHENPPPTTTREVTTPKPPPTSAPATSSSQTAAVPTPTPSGSTAPPFPSPGAQNVYTSVDNTEITWEGAWETTTSTCNATSSAKRCTGQSSEDATGSMSYTFTGYSVAMSFASSNVDYNVHINEKAWLFSGGANAFNCTYEVVYNVKIEEVQTINVMVTIADTSNSRRALPGDKLKKRADASWHLDVNDFVVEVSDTSASSSATGTGSFPTGAINAGSALRARFTYASFPGLIAGLVIMAFFVL